MIDCAKRDVVAADRGAAFWKIAGAGAAFQAGSAAVDSATIVASLTYHLTGSVYAVGAASAVLRAGWLLPQAAVGYLAQRSGRRMPFYTVGAFGRASCIAAIALVLALGNNLPGAGLATGFLVLWTMYAFVSGIVAVPYNDIVGRAIASGWRSRLLAWRFFGGGILAIGVAGLADRWLRALPILDAYAAIFALASVLMLVSSLSFVSAGEPPVRRLANYSQEGFRGFLSAGFGVLRIDTRFRLFLYSQWLGSATLMALPFYIVAATDAGLDTRDAGILLGAQTVGALASNAVWGRIGDLRGKLALLQAVGALRLALPAGVLAILASAGSLGPTLLLPVFATLFVAIGATVNGVTISYLGFLFEISPDERRPAYSAYFNMLASPVALLPLAGAAIADNISLEAVFVTAFVAAIAQLAVYRQLLRTEPARESS